MKATAATSAAFLVKSSKSKGESGSASEGVTDGDASPLIGSRIHRSRHARSGDPDEASAAAATAAAATAAAGEGTTTSDGGDGDETEGARRAQSLPEVTNRLARLERQMLAQRQRQGSPAHTRSPDRVALRRSIQDLRSDVRSAAARGEAEGHMLLARMAALEAAFGQRGWSSGSSEGGTTQQGVLGGRAAGRFMENGPCCARRVLAMQSRAVKQNASA